MQSSLRFLMDALTFMSVDVNCDLQIVKSKSRIHLSPFTIRIPPFTYLYRYTIRALLKS